MRTYSLYRTSVTMRSLEIRTQIIFNNLIKQNQKLASDFVLKPSIIVPSAQNPASSVQYPPSNVQHPESSIQSPKSSIQSPAPNVQRSESRVQRPESRVQRPESRVQRPVAQVYFLRMKEKYYRNNSQKAFRTCFL